MKNRHHRFGGTAVVLAAALIAAASCAQAQVVSFTDSDGVLPVDEGAAIDAPFSVSPALAQATTVFYDVDYDTADADDHSRLSGEVELPTGATAGVIRVSITDDADVELPRETFDLRFTVPGGSSYTVGTTDSVTVNIREGVCDRSHPVEAYISREVLSFSTLGTCREITSEALARVGMSSQPDFSHSNLRLLKAGDFSGLTAVTRLYLQSNSLTTLPSGIFMGLDQLRELRLDNNQFHALPAGLFLGVRDLSKVNLDGNPGRPFTLTPRLQRTGLEDGDLPQVNAQLTLAEGAPFEITVQFEVTSGLGLVEPAGAVIPKGAAQDVNTFLITQISASPVRVTLSASTVPDQGLLGDGTVECTSGCYQGLATGGGEPFVIDIVAPSVSGAAFRSTPATGDTYFADAGETISVGVEFDEDVTVSSGTPVLRLNVGGITRDAPYDLSLSSSTVLVFSYRLAPGDSDDDGVGFAANALALNGARITDLHDNNARLGLGTSAVTDDPAHKVVSRGICGRTRQVQEVILAQLSGIDNCAAVTDSDLAGISVFLPLNGRGITSLQVGDFSGLTQALGVNLFGNRLTSLPAGVFEGLDNSRRLWIGGNDLTTFPPAFFKNLYHLNWVTLNSNRIKRLSEGFFLGAGGLSQVDLSGNPGAPFALTPRLQRVGSTVTNPLPRVNAKLTLPESTPLDIEVRFSTEGGTVSPDNVTLFRGTTQNDVVVAMTQTGAAPVRVTLNVPGIPRFGLRRDGFPECTGNCYQGFIISGGSPFVLDAVAPAVSGAGFFSTPTHGDAYSAQAGETISVGVRFDEDVTVSNGTPALRLDVGGMMRDAAYDLSLSSSTVLVFSYQLAPGDSDDDGVGFAAGALVPNGARITDLHDNDADLALGGHAVMNHPGHRVAPRSFALRFEPAEIVLTPGDSTTVRLTLDNTEALTGGETVAVTLSTSALFEASLERPTLGMPPNSFMEVTVSAREDAPFDSGTLTASGAVAGARVTSGELTVSVLQREVEVLISPDEFTLLRGGIVPAAASSTPVTIQTRPELQRGEIVALDLNAPGGIGLSPQSVTLSSMNQTAIVQVSANMDGAFEGEVTVSTNAGTRTGRTVLHLDEASASVSVRRSVNLRFEWAGAPAPLRLEVGASTTMEVSVEPPLLASEAIAVDLRLASGSGVRLNGRRLVLDAGVDSSTVEVAAQMPLVSDRLTAELDPRGVHVASPPLSLDVQTTTARRVLLTFDPATVQFVSGRSMLLRITTVPPLGGEQSLAAPLTVEGDAPLRFRSGGVLTQVVKVSGETPSTSVMVTTSEAASWAAAGSSAAVTVERESLMADRVEILDPLPVLLVEVTTLHLSVSLTPPRELVLETGMPQEVSLSIGRGELLPGESVRLEAVTDVPGLAFEPRDVVLTSSRPSTTVRVTASQDNLQGELRFEAETGVVLSEGTSLDVRVKRDFRLRFDPPAVTLAAGNSADVRVMLEGAEDLNAGQSVGLAVQSPEGINFSPGPLSRLTPSRVASLRVSRDVGAGLGEHVVTITSAPDSDVRLLPARLPVTVVPFEVTVSFEPSTVALLRGGRATAVVRADPPLQFSERIDVALIPVAGFEVEPSRVLLEQGSGSVQPVTISASERTSDQGFIFLRERALGALDNALVRFDRGLETQIERGVELELTREEDGSLTALGVPVTIRLSTSPLLVTGESVEVRLRTQDDVLRLNEETFVLHGGRQSALFSATPRQPGRVGQITASGVGRGVTVVEGATLDFEAREKAERVSFEFDPPSVQVGRGSETTVRLATRPLLGAGQSISAVLEAGGDRGDAALGASGRYQAVELAGGGKLSQVVKVSVPTQAEIGSTAVVSIAEDSVLADGVSLEMPLPELTVEIVTPRITVSFASVGGGAVDVLLLSPGETETIEVRFDSGRSAVLKMETEGEGLTVSPATITFPQPKPTTRIAVIKVSASAAEVAGTLKPSVVSVAELSEPSALPVRVRNTLSFDPAEVSVKRGESKEITLRLGSTRSLAAGERVTVDLSTLELAGNFGLSPNEVTFSAVQPAVTVEITAETDAPVGTVIRSRSQPWPAPALASGSIALAEPLRVSVSPRTFEVLFEPDEIVLVGGGVAPATVSMTVTVKAAPEFLPDEGIVADLEIDPDGASLALSVSRVTLDSQRPTTRVTVTASSPGDGAVRVAVEDALSAEVAVEGSLSVEVIRAVEPELIGIGASLVAGASTPVTVTTNPPLMADETAVVLLGAESGALSWSTPRLVLSAAEASTEVTVTADVPDTVDRLTLSWQGEGVSVIGGDLNVPVTIEQAATVSVVFEPEELEVGQGRSKVFRVTTDPPLADGQSVSAQLVLPAFPSGFSLDVDRVSLSGMNELQRSQQVEVSVSASTPIGAMVSVGLDVISASGVDVRETLPSLPVTVTLPRITIEFSPEDELIVKNHRAATLSLSRDNGLTGEQSVSLNVSTSGRGLSVSPRTVELSGNRPSTVVTVEADHQAHNGRLGQLRVQASRGAALQAPAILPIRVFSVTIAPQANESVSIAEGGEGENADAVVRVTPTPMTTLRVSYTVGTPGDTADADDYSVPDSFVIPAGESSALLIIKITDDDEIEPPREQFKISLDESVLYHVPTSSSSILVIIKEGVCDRTPQVRDAIRDDAECDEVTSDDLAGLTSMSLPGKSIGPRGLRVGDFSGMDELTEMILNNNSIFSLPPGIFAGLDRLKRLHLENNELRDLPPGVFAGLTRLEQLHLHGNAVEPVVLTVALRRVNQPPAAPAQFKLVVEEGAPFQMNVGLTVTGRTASASANGPPISSLTIPKGSIESPIFFLSDSGSQEVNIGLTPPTVPSGCTLTRCYQGIATSVSASFILDAVAPMLTGVEIVSAPGGEVNPGGFFSTKEVYASGETISVALTFNEEIVAIPEREDLLLHLEIGSERRIARYDADRSGTDTLVFSYEVAGDDLDSDGISVREDALALNGARLEDRSGITVNPSLAGHAIENAPDHVVLQTLSLVFDPPVLEVEWSTSATFVVATRPPISRAGASVRVLLDLTESLEAGLDFVGRQGTGYDVHLDSVTAEQNITVTATTRAAIGSSTTLSYTSLSGGLPLVQVSELPQVQLRRPLPLLQVKVTPPKRTVTFSPADGLFLARGGRGEVTLGFAGNETPSTTATLRVSADGGFSVAQETVRLGPSTPTAVVTVTAPATTERGALKVEAMSGVALREAAELPLLSGDVRDFTLSFEPASLDLPAGVSTPVRVVLGNAKSLAEDEVVHVVLTSGAGLELSGPPVLLDRSNPAMAVDLRALLDASLGASRVTAQVSAAQARYLIARFAEAALPVEILERRIMVLFEPARVELTPVASEEEDEEFQAVAVIRTEPALVESEEVFLNLTVLNRQEQVILSGARVQPFTVILRPGADSQNVEVFASNKEIALVRPQRDPRSTVDERKLRLGDLRVIFPNSGLQLRVKVFLEGALE